MRKAVCVTSGGMDSISMALAMHEDGYNVTLFHGALGQKAQAGEVRAVTKISNLMAFNRYIVDISWLGKLGKSSLTDKQFPIPKGMNSLYESTNIGCIENGLWTPARNVVLLSCAAAHAEAEGAEVITWGANQSETAYPDNTMEFADRFSHMLKMGCLKPPIVIAPLYHLDKVELLLWGEEKGYGHVYSWTWSCDDFKGLPCGECGCCCNRRFAFMMANKKNRDIVDTQEYVNPTYFYNTYLPDLRESCTEGMWMYKYLHLI